MFFLGYLGAHFWVCFSLSWKEFNIFSRNFVLMFLVSLRWPFTALICFNRIFSHAGDYLGIFLSFLELYILVLRENCLILFYEILHIYSYYTCNSHKMRKTNIFHDLWNWIFFHNTLSRISCFSFDGYEGKNNKLSVKNFMFGNPLRGMFWFF